MKITQMQMAFYKLYSARQEDRERFVPLWEFGGEMLVKELNQWVLMSYKCPTRMSDIYNRNPNLVERITITGKSGSKYFAYRFVPDVKPELILDPQLQEFYKLLKK